MHTINGRPAMFDGSQVVYGLAEIATHEMRDTLSQIRKDQRVSMKFRKTFKDAPGTYVPGYIRVRITR